MKFADLPPEKQEKAVSDVFCVTCQKSFRLETFTEREFRGTLLIEGTCPTCGSPVAKPVSSHAGE
jgi:endogenous inhibitor of DNA gyrase (YacG/DUF329 family)